MSWVCIVKHEPRGPRCSHFLCEKLHSSSTFLSWAPFRQVTVAGATRYHGLRAGARRILCIHRSTSLRIYLPPLGLFAFSLGATITDSRQIPGHVSRQLCYQAPRD